MPEASSTVTPSRPVVQLHTIQQWFSLDQPVRVEILKALKVKDRLSRFLYSLNDRNSDEHVQVAEWRRCSACAESPYPGYFLAEPRYDGIHPSSIYGECLYKIYLDMTGAPSQERVEASLRITFDIGKKVHELFQGYGRRGAWGPYYVPEPAINGELQELAELLMLEGHADADNIIVVDDIPGAPIFEVGVVHEYKTKKSELFKKLTRPDPAHKQQAMIYAAALNRPVVVYLYLNKDDSNILDFPVEFDPAIWSVMEGKARYLKDHYDRREPPPATTGYACKECKYKSTCESYQQEVRKVARR